MQTIRYISCLVKPRLTNYVLEYFLVDSKDSTRSFFPFLGCCFPHLIWNSNSVH